MPILDEGQTIRDTYEVERFLGEGAFAEVYRVKHRFLGRQAMKVFKQEGMVMEDIEEMLGEAIMLSKIGHPNIVRVFDANVLEDHTRGYFTMEHVAGGSLDKFWNSFGMAYVPVETTIDLLKQVCRGLCVAHDEDPPVIHRDIKPQNILVGYDATGLRARLSDFGLAKTVNPLTLMATSAGTLPFKPPEAFTQQKGDSPASDTWAVGVTLYLLLTDRLPFQVDETLGWDRQPFDKEFPLPSELNPDSNPSLDRIVAKALNPDPEARYRRARLMLNDLQAWKPGRPAPLETTRDPMLTKTSIGASFSSPDEVESQGLVDNALTLKSADRLSDAADLMEEAFNKWPPLRDRYEAHVKLWRNGISM